MSAPDTLPTRSWQGIESVEPPVRRHDHEDLLAMAESMLEARRRGFPGLVAAGDMAEADARAEIAAFEDLVADWRVIVARGAEGEPGSLASVPLRRRALDASLARIADLARARGGFSETLSRQAECVIALRWHLEPGRDQVALARLSHQLRAEAAAKRRENARCA